MFLVSNVSDENQTVQPRHVRDESEKEGSRRIQMKMEKENLRKYKTNEYKKRQRGEAIIGKGSRKRRSVGGGKGRIIQEEVS